MLKCHAVMKLTYTTKILYFEQKQIIYHPLFSQVVSITKLFTSSNLKKIFSEFYVKTSTYTSIITPNTTNMS